MPWATMNGSRMLGTREGPMVKMASFGLVKRACRRMVGSGMAGDEQAMKERIGS